MILSLVSGLQRPHRQWTEAQLKGKKCQRDHNANAHELLLNAIDCILDAESFFRRDLQCIKLAQLSCLFLSMKEVLVQDQVLSAFSNCDRA